MSWQTMNPNNPHPTLSVENFWMRPWEWPYPDSDLLKKILDLCWVTDLQKPPEEHSMLQRLISSECAHNLHSLLTDRKLAHKGLTIYEAWFLAYYMNHADHAKRLDYQI